MKKKASDKLSYGSHLSFDKPVTPDTNTDQKKKRTRVSGKHSHDACGTCRIRRVKCDEEKPECRRCKIFGIACDGYRPKPKPLSSRDTPLLPRIQNSIFVPPFAPTVRLDNDEEYQYFTLFITQTYYETFPFCEGEPLCPLIIDSCEVEAIRKSIIAIGALHKTAMMVQDVRSLSLDQPMRKGESPNADHQNAIRYYSQAISSMRNMMASGIQDVRTTLITCLTNFIFEAFHGNFSLADAQIQTGVKLLEDWMQTQPNREYHALGFSSPSPSYLEDFLVQMFGCLEAQTIVFQDNRSFESHNELRNEGTHIIQTMPSTFKSLEEAYPYLQLMLRRFEHFMFVFEEIVGLASFICKPDCSRPQIDRSGRECDGCTLEDLIHQSALHRAEFDQWNASFQSFLQNCDRNGEIRSSMFARTLSLHFKTTYLVVCTMCVPSGAVFDSFTDEFCEIVNLAEELLHDLAQKSTTGFIFDNGVILPLYITGYHCRVPALRRRAINLLLSHPRREGLYDSVLLGRMAEWIQNVEEEYIEDGYVPGWARVHRLKPSYHLQSRIGYLTCIRQVPTAEGYIEVERSTTVTW